MTEKRKISRWSLKALLTGAFVFLSIMGEVDILQAGTGNYINNLFYNRRLQTLRTSYDRWQGLGQTYYPDQHISEVNYHIYSTIYDFNWGRDVNGRNIYPQMLGLALGWPYVGVYVLGYTTDFANYTRPSAKETEGHYDACTIGVNLDLKYVALQTDITADGSTADFYFKAFVPIARTYFGIRINPYEKTIVTGPMGDEEHIEDSGDYNFDVLDFGTSVLRYVNVGFSYYCLAKAKYVPNISTALHQWMDVDDREDLGWDLEFFFETRTETFEDGFKDYEMRLVFYYFFGGDLVRLKHMDDSGINVKATVFVGVSYKSSEDRFSQTATESGMVYNGQNGFGFEVGIGLRVLGFREFGFEEDTYVKLSYFYNYSNYFERYPGMQQGIKFRVLY